MNIWERIMKFFKKDQPKQIAAPIEQRNMREEIAVSEEYLNVSKDKQMKEKNREFQLMFAINNVCGKRRNLFGNEQVERAIQNTLQRYGYGDELQLDQIDLGILSRLNMNLNNRIEQGIPEQVSSYINNVTAMQTAKLVNRVKEQTINTAKSFNVVGEQETLGYIPTDVLSQFEPIIQEEKEANNLEQCKL